MLRLAWATDIHLEFLSFAQREAFCETLRQAAPDAVLLGGDIGTARVVEDFLRHMEARLQRPLYFVLGNHDFYGGSIAEVRALAGELTRARPWLRWLPEAGTVALTADTGLIGHDSWADGRLGSAMRSRVVMNDYLVIRDFMDLSQPERFARMNALGDEAAAYFRAHLPAAARRFRRLLLLTHVPPFREACWHGGRLSDDDYLPHFACRAVGEALRAVMEAHPACDLTVLCGHTHGAGQAEILPNLHVTTAGAVYGQPQIQAILTVE